MLIQADGVCVQQARFIADHSLISSTDYHLKPERYRGLLVCPLCGEKAWYMKAVQTDTLQRSACFAAQHQPGCDAATTVAAAETVQATASTVRAPGSHYAPAGLWQSIKAPQLGGSAGFDVNTALRQLLSHLCRNADFAKQGQKIQILAASDRELLSGTLAEHLVHTDAINEQQLEALYLFWGRVNNVNERDFDDPRDDELWLNTGDYRKEPSIFIDADLRSSVLRRLNLSDIDALNGSDFILLGHAGKSAQGKFTLHIAMSKYLAVRLYRPTATTVG
jgi:hypothetical protein